MEKRYDQKEICIVLVIVIILTLIFNSKAYLNWANNLKVGIFREVFLSFIKPIDMVSEILYLDSIYKNTRRGFLSFVNEKYKKSIKKEEIIENNIETNYSVKNPLKIIMLGDSMIKEALSMAFLKLTKNNDELHTTVSAFYSSGLSRVDIFDWNNHLNLEIVDKKYDFAIVMLGMNDAQDIIEDNKNITLFTKKWEEIYKDRLKEFLAKLSINLKKSAWLGLPVMRDSKYNERMMKLNNIIKNECDNFENILFIDSNKILYNNCEYKEYIKVKDKLIQVRLYDGKHFTKDGALIIMEDVIKIIYNIFKFESLPKINRHKLIKIKDF